jgi:hypothetical protein
VKTRPAETSTAAGAIALLVGLVAGLDGEAVAIAGIALGFLPAAVTALVNAGGIRGFARKLWSGRT